MIYCVGTRQKNFKFIIYYYFYLQNKIQTNLSKEIFHLFIYLFILRRGVGAKNKTKQNKTKQKTLNGSNGTNAAGGGGEEKKRKEKRKVIRNICSYTHSLDWIGQDFFEKVNQYLEQ